MEAHFLKPPTTRRRRCLSKALADGVRDGLADGDVGLPLPE